MLKKFKLDGKTFNPKQDFGNFEQWECNGDLFVVSKKNPTRKDIVETYNNICTNNDKYGH